MFSIQYDKGKMKSLVQGLNGFVAGSPQRLKIAITAGVLDVLTDATQNAPYQTGTLRRSLTHKVDSSPRQAIGYVGSNLEYSRIQEMGGQTGRNHSTRIRPKRYLARAIDSNKAKISERFRKMKIIQG